MATTTTRPTRRRPRSPLARPTRGASSPPVSPSPASSAKKIASNFLHLGAAEVICRATSVAVTLSLTRSLSEAGYGRVEFAFSVVFWLVLVVRDGFEVVAARELARHPRLARPLVNHLLAVKLAVASVLYGVLVVGGLILLPGDAERAVLGIYGLLLFSTACGIDYVYRGLERMGIVALSLCVRTAIYAVGVGWLLSRGGLEGSRLAWIPCCLVVGEFLGIGLVWGRYVREFGWPRLAWDRRFLRVFLRRGRPVLLIQLAGTVLSSVDLMVVGFASSWASTGMFGAPHRMVAAVLTFGLIFQQVVFPSLARSWRSTSAEGRRSMDSLVRILVLAMLPIAVGTTVLAGPLVRLMFPAGFAPAAILLALGIWRAPLLTLGSLYGTALIALNREGAWVRLLGFTAIGSLPIVAGSLAAFGPAGAAGAVGITALVLVVGGYVCLAREGRQPAWHHHLARPGVASTVMAMTCLAVRDRHVVVAVVSGAIAYGATLVAIGGVRRSDVEALLGRRGSATRG